MPTGRTTSNHTRTYFDGYDLSGNARAIGPLVMAVEEPDLSGFSDAVKGTLPGQGIGSIGTFDGVFDNTAAGFHAAMQGAGVLRNVMVILGIQGAPAQGDPAYCGVFQQLAYQPMDAGGAVYVTIPFSSSKDVTAVLNYLTKWGILLHAKAAETVVNTAIGVDELAATAKGGYMMYQAFTSNGTATIKVQDAAVNTDVSFADVVGLTSGSIDASVTPKSGIASTTAITSTIRRYTRWQVAFGTATSISFVLCVVRGNL